MKPGPPVAAAHRDDDTAETSPSDVAAVQRWEVEGGRIPAKEELADA